MSNDDNILWTAITKARPHIRKYYRVQDALGNKGIAFYNQNRTWTIVDNGALLGHEVYFWAYMDQDGGWERLKQYMKNISTKERDEWTVHEDYSIKYEGRPCVGRTNAQLVTEDVWGSHEYHSIDYIKWDQVEVFKRLEVW